jgi:hypothetical protein
MKILQKAETYLVTPVKKKPKSSRRKDDSKAEAALTPGKVDGEGDGEGADEDLEFMLRTAVRKGKGKQLDDRGPDACAGADCCEWKAGTRVVALHNGVHDADKVPCS